MVTVAVLGASNNPDRYSYQAVDLLAKNGHTVYPIHPLLIELLGHKAYGNLDALMMNEDISLNTLSIYVSPKISSEIEDQILRAKPARVIFNPGSENPDLATKLKAIGSEVLDACTLVMLRTGQF
jgi:predicted CoA-binding protein